MTRLKKKVETITCKLVDLDRDLKDLADDGKKVMSITYTGDAYYLVAYETDNSD